MPKRFSSGLQICQRGVSEITIHSLRSNWPGARREGGSVSTAILGRLSNEAPGQFQRNPKGGLAFGRRCCRSEEHTSELQSLAYLVCRLLLEKKKYMKVK